MRFFPLSGNYCSVDGIVCLLHSEDTRTMGLKAAPELAVQTILHMRMKAENCHEICDRCMVSKVRKTFLV